VTLRKGCPIRDACTRLGGLYSDALIIPKRNSELSCYWMCLRWKLWNMRGRIEKRMEGMNLVRMIVAEQCSLEGMRSLARV
jgi:hypothetical protein